MSSRSTVLSAIETALNASTGINRVTRNLENWWDWQPAVDMPGVTIIDRETAIERASYLSTGEDMEAMISLTCRGYVHDRNNDTMTKRTNLIADIEKAMTNSTAIDAVVAMVHPVRVDTDAGILENYSVFDSEFEVTYFYNHATP